LRVALILVFRVMCHYALQNIMLDGIIHQSGLKACRHKFSSILNCLLLQARF